MRNTSRMVVIAAGIAVTAIAAASTASAAPAYPVPDINTLSTDIAPGVHYTGNVTDHSAVITTPLGTLSLLGTQFQVQDDSGKTILGAPVGPIKAATAVPAAAGAKSVGAPAPHDPLADFNGAISVLINQFGLATGVGALVGGVAGLVAGCPLGAVTAGLTMFPVAVPTMGMSEIPNMVLGCMVGASVIGAIGVIVGGAILGVPVGIVSTVEAYNTLHAAGDI